MKKVIVFGGGTGLSNLLSGLKLFPMEVTTVISVSDNGSSTGILKEEYGIFAVRGPRGIPNSLSAALKKAEKR